MFFSLPYVTRWLFIFITIHKIYLMLTSLSTSATGRSFSLKFSSILDNGSKIVSSSFSFNVDLLLDEKQRKQQWNTKRKVGKAIPTATIDNATIFPVIVISILFNMLKFEPCWLWIVALKTFMRSTWRYGKTIRDKMRNKITISRWT